MEIAQHPQCGEIRFPVITCGQISIQCVHWVIVHAISYFNGIKATGPGLSEVETRNAAAFILWMAAQFPDP